MTKTPHAALLPPAQGKSWDVPPVNHISLMKNGEQVGRPRVFL